VNKKREKSVILKIVVVNRKPKKRLGVLSVEGEIEIGDFRELIYMPLDYWSVEDYERQWREGIERLKTHDTSCLVATIHDPKIRRYINWWLLYKIENKVYVRNYLLVEDMYEERIGNNTFTIENCYDFINPRFVSARASEWVVDYP
jgi:hypothetical protein